VRYQEYAPSPQLVSIVQCLWTLEGHAAELGDDAQPILPDGRSELVVHFGDAFERIHANGGVDRQPALLFAGQLTGPLVLRPTGRISVLGVRLHPFGAAALSTQPQNEFLGLTLGMDDVSRALFRSLTDLRDSTASPGVAAAAVQGHLAQLVDPSRVDTRVRHVVDTIQRTRGRISVEDLARRVGLTRRHLERRFKSTVGVSPKRLARIARFQHALQILTRADVPQRGAYTAAECGYADQAHFVRECRELCGHAPEAYLLERAQLTGFFTECAVTASV
jgi:AraC-like DNA-binding protein